MNQIDQFLKNKVAEMRRAAPDCDVHLFPEADGYSAYGKFSVPVYPILVKLEKVNEFILGLTREGRSVALLDHVSLGQHGGWRTILIAKIPAATNAQPAEDFA